MDLFNSTRNSFWQMCPRLLFYMVLKLHKLTGEAPLKVNSSTQVSLLNADLMDGRSAALFVANSTYRLGQGQERAGTGLGDGSKVMSQSCLAGDRLLFGGPASVNVNSDVLDSFATDTNMWQARINDSAVSGGTILPWSCSALINGDREEAG